jgi:hypothetical protein
MVIQLRQSVFGSVGISFVPGKSKERDEVAFRKAARRIQASPGQIIDPAIQNNQLPTRKGARFIAHHLLNLTNVSWLLNCLIELWKGRDKANSIRAAR